MHEKIKNAVRKLSIPGYKVEEGDAEQFRITEEVVAQAQGRSWGAPRVNVKSVAHLHDLEPTIRFRADGALVIHFGSRLGRLVQDHLSAEEIQDLCMGLGRRVTRELHDAAMELAQARRSYLEDRKERLTKKT